MSTQTYTEASAEEIVKYYYKAVSNGDLQSLKQLMTERSYFMTLEAFALKLSFKDGDFKLLLSHMQEDETILYKVENRLIEEGTFQKPFPLLEIDRIIENGHHRKIVQYREEGILKKLYFSYESTGWKINYYAGRRKV